MFGMRSNCAPLITNFSIGGVMVSMLASSVVDRGFEPRSGQTKDYAIGICCFSAKHAALRRKSKDWLPRNQNNVSKWSDMSTRWLLFQWASIIKIQLSVLVQYKADVIIISLKIYLFLPWYSWQIAVLALNNNYSLNHSYRHLLPISRRDRLRTGASQEKWNRDSPILWFHVPLNRWCPFSCNWN
jgi:hypothetical protein